MAIEGDSGKIRWTKTIVAARPKQPVHPSNTYATETPCADTERVYVYFGATGTLAALTHAGEEVWRMEWGGFPMANGFGSGSSPALYNGKLYLANFNEEKSFIVAVNAADGKEIWRREPASQGSAWATPFVWRNKQRTEIIACGNKVVTSHDPQTGEELWRLGKIDTAFAPSPAATEDLLLLAASSPFSAAPIYAVKAGARGDITLAGDATSNDGIAWHRNRSGVGMSSPVAFGKYLYLPGSGILTCVDIATGEQKYRQRLPNSRTIAASSVTCGDKLLVLDESGHGTWVKTGPEFNVLGQGSLPDTFWSSPAVSGDRIFLRGLGTLYCISTR
jgi:outer membrane protein assembly factor BamB